MSTRVFMVHGWGGSPDGGWFPWLKEELQARGFDVRTPEMPGTERPAIGAWVSHLAESVGRPDTDTYFIGHSIGTQTILRYAERLDERDRIGGMLLVAAFTKLKNIELLADDPAEARRIASAWIDAPIEWSDVLTHTENITTILSNDDPFVPLSVSRVFSEKLHSRVLILRGKGHIDQDRVPAILTEFLSLVEKRRGM